jgi:hypothetical protein
MYVTFLTFGARALTLSSNAEVFSDFEEFPRAVADGAEVVPVYRQLLADRLTPVTAFELLGDAENAFLLESVVGIEKIGRYSFIATSPQFVYEAKDGRAVVTRAGSSRRRRGRRRIRWRTWRSCCPSGGITTIRGCRILRAGWWGTRGMTRFGITRGRS